MAKVLFSILWLVAALSQVSSTKFLLKSSINRKNDFTQESTARNCNCGCSERTTYYYPKAEIRQARVPLPYEPTISENQPDSVLLTKILSTLDAILATEKIIAAAVSRPVWSRPNPYERGGNRTESTISNRNGTSNTNSTSSNPYARRPYYVPVNT